MESLKLIDRLIYDRYIEIVTRYLSLYPYGNNERFDTANIQANYALQDINSAINKVNDGDLNLDILYQLIIKTDYLVSFVKYIYEVLNNEKANFNKVFSYENDENHIVEFRLLRNLSIAHPLDTTRANIHGFDKNNNKWCEDIIVAGDIYRCDKELKDADYIMRIRCRGKLTLENRPINIKKDIIDIVNITQKYIKIYTYQMNAKIRKEEEKLKSEIIKLPDIEFIYDYIIVLKSELSKRYCYAQNEYDNDFYFLDEILNIFDFNFKDNGKQILLEEFKYSIKCKLKLFTESLQKMTFDTDNSKEKLLDALRPNNDGILSYLKQDESNSYKLSKIESYLYFSNNMTYETAIEKLNKYGKQKCYDVNICTDIEFAILMLLDISSSLNRFFKFDFNVTNTELIIQWRLLCYLSNCRSSGVML